MLYLIALLSPYVRSLPMHPWLLIFISFSLTTIFLQYLRLLVPLTSSFFIEIFLSLLSTFSWANLLNVFCNSS